MQAFINALDQLIENGSVRRRFAKPAKSMSWEFYNKFTNEKVDLSHLNIIVEHNRAYLVTYLNIEGEYTKEYCRNIRVVPVRTIKQEWHYRVRK